jgi:hypothetical protein
MTAVTFRGEINNVLYILDFLWKIKAHIFFVLFCRYTTTRQLFACLQRKLLMLTIGSKN